MLFDFNFFSALLLIFFVHGLVYSCLLLQKSWRNDTLPDAWLAVCLLLCVFIISPWMLGFAGWYDNQPYRDFLFYFPFQQLLFIGPVSWFYFRSVLNPSFRFGRREFLHLIPGILYLLFSLVMWVTDKLILKDYYFLASGTDPDFDSWYQITGFISMLIYFSLSFRYYILYRKIMLQLVSYAGNLQFRWIRNFLVAFLAMLILRLVFFVINEWFDLAYKGTWWYYLFFSLLFYYIAINGYANAVETRVQFREADARHIQLLPAPDYPATEELIPIEPETNPGNNDLLKSWCAAITKSMEEEQAWADAELTLSRLAGMLRTNAAMISRAINQGFGMNFNDYINQYRIQAVQQKLEKGEQETQTLLGIAYDCGFNSKATFNRAFKKATGLSPKEWMQQKKT